MAVAALKCVDHGGDGEGQQEEPYDQGDLRRLLKHPDAVFPSGMDDAEVAVERQGDEEGDAGSSVEEQHEEHGLTDRIVVVVPQVVLIVMDLKGKTGHQQEISHHYVEQEDTVVLPESEPKTKREWTKVRKLSA